MALRLLVRLLNEIEKVRAQNGSGKGMGPDRGFFTMSFTFPVYFPSQRDGLDPIDEGGLEPLTTADYIPQRPKAI